MLAGEFRGPVLDLVCPFEVVVGRAGAFPSTASRSEDLSLSFSSVAVDGVHVLHAESVVDRVAFCDPPGPEHVHVVVRVEPEPTLAPGIAVSPLAPELLQVLRVDTRVAG